MTSIQKMSRIQLDQGVNAKDIERIRGKRVVFVIDECHRDTFGDMLSDIKTTFPGAIFFGFTGTPCTDLQPLKMVAHYSMLKVFGHPVKQWLEAVRETRIDGVMVHVESNDMLKKLTEQHPELVSMHIQRSTDVTDLTPLLSLEQLEYVRISSDMKKAIKSLEGAEYRFELEIEQ